MFAHTSVKHRGGNMCQQRICNRCATFGNIKIWIPSTTLASARRSSPTHKFAFMQNDGQWYYAQNPFHLRDGGQLGHHLGLDIL